MAIIITHGVNQNDLQKVILTKKVSVLPSIAVLQVSSLLTATFTFRIIAPPLPEEPLAT